MSYSPSIVTKEPKYLQQFAMIWVSFLVIAALTAAKTFSIGPLVFSVSILAYPVTYIFADIFTEVYGYAQTRRIVWTGLVCLLCASFITSLYALVPPDASYTDNDSYRSVFLGAPILAIANIFSFFSGELTNSFVIARMKVQFHGRFLNARMICSTIAGQMTDNAVFYSLALLLGGFFTLDQLPNIILSSVAFCVLWEILALPLTTRLIKRLKKAEGLDTYDYNTDFNPFAITFFQRHSNSTNQAG